MIPLRNITACDHCGVCCEQHPCLLSNYRDFRKVEELHPDAKKHIRIEKDGERFRVRISAGPCVYHIDNRCSIEDIKPAGGRDFKCWDLATYAKTFHWTHNQLRKLGFQ